MKKILLTGIITCLLLFSGVGLASAGIPGDNDCDTYVSEEELSDGIIDFMESTYLGEAVDDPLSGGALSIAACSYLSPGDGELNAAMIFLKDSIDPGNGWMGWYVRKAGIYETLFSLDENAALVPELASGYNQVTDTRYEIYLREDVIFHDGTPFNADAAIYSLNRVLDPDNSRHAEYDFIDSISKTDDYTIVITTTEPYAPTLASIADPLCSMISPALENPDDEAAGTGPFILESWEPAASLSVVKNSKYWGGDVALHAANFVYISDPETRALMLKSGDVDIARGIPATEYEEFQDSADYDVLTKETLRDYYMFVNTGKAPLDNKSVRQALNYAIDRQQIVDTALEGVAGSPAKSIYPSIMPWSKNNRGLVGYPFNQEKALELLEAASITDTNDDGWLDYNNETFELTIEAYSSRPACTAGADVVAAQFENIGIKTNVEVLGSSAIKEDMASGTYDLAMYSYGSGTTGDPDYIVSLFAYSGAKEAGWCRYNNPQVDAWIEEARRCMNANERQDLYDTIQEQLIEDSPQIYLFYERELVAQSSSVSGYVIYPNEVTFMTKDVRIAV